MILYNTLIKELLRGTWGIKSDSLDEVMKHLLPKEVALTVVCLANIHSQLQRIADQLDPFERMRIAQERKKDEEFSKWKQESDRFHNQYLRTYARWRREVGLPKELYGKFRVVLYGLQKPGMSLAQYEKVLYKTLCTYDYTQMSFKDGSKSKAAFDRWMESRKTE